MDKKGQFFLIATIVIAGLIIGLSMVQISTKAPKEDKAIYDLSKEIGFESNKVIDYGVFNSVSSTSALENLTKYYATTNPETDIMVIYGNEDSLKGARYIEDVTGSFSLNYAGSSSNIISTDITLSDISEYIHVRGNRINVTINENISYDFELKQGENFYIVLEKKQGEERIVATN